MKALIIGGTGLIGRKITERSIAKGHDTYILTRGETPLEGVPAKIIRGDRNDYAELKRVFQENSFDVVVDQRCYNPENAMGLWKAIDGRVGQLIFTSTCCVYSRPFAKLPIREDEAETNPDPSFRYGYEKRLTELALLEAASKSDTQLTIIRPSLTVGEGSMIIGFFAGDYTLIHRLKNGLPLICPGSGQSLWTITYTGDLASGYVGAFGNSKTYGQTYHMTTDKAHTWENLFRTMARLAGGPDPDMVYIPGQTLARIKRCWQTEMIYRDKQDTAVFDNSKAKRDIPEFSAETPFETIFTNALAWFDADPARRMIDPEAMSMEDEIIQIYRRKELEMADGLNS